MIDEHETPSTPRFGFLYESATDTQHALGI